MISKTAAQKADNDNYKRLARYIVDANHKGEKCLLSWCVSTSFADDKDGYEFGIKEVEHTQNMNTRSTKTKTYHLVISFRMEDEAKLTQADFKAIEERFAKALGLSEHQRHCGVHTNTENLHMHVAYNLIHPTTYRRHEPFRDYYKRDKLCRELEKEYRLSPDNGIDYGVDNGVENSISDIRLSAQSATKESLTGEESFERFVMDRHDDIMELITKARVWEDVHQAFALYSLEIKQRGNGLAIKNIKGKQSLKASRFDREISYAKLTEHFGQYTPPQGTYKAKDWYRKRPRHSQQSGELWKEFVQVSRTNEIEAIKARYYQEKIRITGLAVSRYQRNELLKKARLMERLEITNLRQEMTIQADNWIDFLKTKAYAGNEEALTALQDRPQSSISSNQVNKDTPPTAPSQIANTKEFLYKTHENLANTLQKQTQIDAKKLEILTSDLSPTTKKKLSAVIIFESITNQAFTYTLSRHGHLVFRLANGGKIIDNGQDIISNEQGKLLAEKYKKARFYYKTMQNKQKAKAPYKFKDTQYLYNTSDNHNESKENPQIKDNPTPTLSR